MFKQGPHFRGGGKDIKTQTQIPWVDTQRLEQTKN